MSLKAATKPNTIVVLKQSTTAGASLGVQRQYSPSRSLEGRAIPITGTRRDALLKQGMQKPHEVFFNFDPKLDERDRLRWGDTVLRIMSLPVDVAGMGSMWTLTADAISEDNADVAIQ